MDIKEECQRRNTSAYLSKYQQLVSKYNDFERLKNELVGICDDLNSIRSVENCHSQKLHVQAITKSLEHKDIFKQIKKQ